MKDSIIQKVGVFISLVFVLNFFIACKDNKSPKPSLTDKQIEEKLIEANRKRVRWEKINIDSLIEEKQWQMIETGTGLRYEILEAGFGDSIQSGNRVEVAYTIINLKGDTIYTSQQDGTEIFKVGMDHVESGIHEAVGYMKVGDSARVILPAHLAHGLMGDDNQVHSNATLIYYLKIVSAQ